MNISLKVERLKKYNREGYPLWKTSRTYLDWGGSLMGFVRIARL